MHGAPAEADALLGDAVAQRHQRRHDRDGKQYEQGAKRDAPVAVIGDHAGKGARHHIAHQRPADETRKLDLAALGARDFAEQSERARHDAAGGDARQHPRGDQHGEGMREHAEQHRGERSDAGDRNQPRLAEDIGQRAEERLQQRIRQREGGAEPGGDDDVDAHLRRNLRQHRIKAAHHHVGGQPDEADRQQLMLRGHRRASAAAGAPNRKNLAQNNPAGTAPAPRQKASAECRAFSRAKPYTIGPAAMPRKYDAECNDIASPSPSATVR